MTLKVIWETMWKHNLSSRVSLQGMEFTSSTSPLPTADSLREASGRNVSPICEVSSLAPSLALHCYCRGIFPLMVSASSWESPIPISEQVKMLTEPLALTTVWGTWSRLELSFGGKQGTEMPGMGSCSPTYTGSHSHSPPTCRVRDWISSLSQGNHKSPLPGPFSLHLQWPLAKEVGRGFYAKYPKCFHFTRSGWAHFPDNCF